MYTRTARGELPGPRRPIASPDDLPDRVLVPGGPAEAAHRVRGSRFLARLQRARTAEEAREAREEARRRHHDATHHVFACRLLDGTARWDDDGEPSGTAGAPAAEALVSADLREAAVVVVRWFGGTELGTGGLRRAYREAAARAAERAPGREAAPARVVTVRYGHPDTGAVMRALEAAGARRRTAAWGARVEMELAVPLREVAGLERSVRDATAGRAEVLAGEELVLVPV